MSSKDEFNCESSSSTSSRLKRSRLSEEHLNSRKEIKIKKSKFRSRCRNCNTRLDEEDSDDKLCSDCVAESNKRFICKYCSKKFKQVNQYKHHLKVTHTSKRTGDDKNKNNEDGDEYDKAEKLPITTKKPILKINLFSKLNKSIIKENNSKASSTRNRTRSESEEVSEDEDDKSSNTSNLEKNFDKSYLPEYPNIEVIKLEMNDDEEEDSDMDNLNLRYVLFKDRLIVSKNAFN